MTFFQDFHNRLPGVLDIFRALLFKAPVFSVSDPKISPGSIRMKRTGSSGSIKIVQSKDAMQT